MRLVLDAGALIGIDRDDRRVAGLIELGRRADAEVVTVAPVLGQAWRDGSRQARLARALPMIEIEETTIERAKAAGQLLARAGSSDIVDALLAMQARPHDQILTSDPGDLETLMTARSTSAHVVPV